MVYLDKENFKELVSSGNCLVDFYATWCGPCKMMEPVLESIDDKINIIKVDIDKFPDLTSEFRIMSVPTFIFFKDGVKQEEVIGFHSEEDLIEIIERL